MPTSRRRLWIVDPSVRRAEDECVAEVLRDWPGESRLFRPALVAGEGPGPGDGYAMDGVVVLGSAASVHDTSVWIERLALWLDPLLDGRVRRPVLGVCFGHQLVAHRAGGEVAFARPDRGKIVGVDVVALHDGRLLAGRHDLRVVFSHREEVRRPPAGFAVVAARGPGRIDGLEHARLPLFSFQFHPEARGEFAARAGIDPGAIDARLRADSQRLLGAFRALVACGQEVFPPWSPAPPTPT